MAQALLNNQGKDQVEASIQGLREAIVGFSSWGELVEDWIVQSGEKKEKKIKNFIQKFKTHIALNPELQNIEIFWFPSSLEISLT